MKKPRLVMVLSEIWSMTDPRDLQKIVSFAVEAEKAGFDAVMIGEHVVMGPNSNYLGNPPENPRDWLTPGNQPSDYPHPNGLHMLSAISTATTRLRLLGAAVITPFRHPLMLAKEMATIDLLSKGRLIVMPGVSWQQEEYAALGIPFKDRGAILDEQLEIWDRLWRNGSPVRHDGRLFKFDDVYVLPAPYNGSVTLWTGGNQLLAPMRRRFIKYSQGLFTVMPISADEMTELHGELVAAGRDPAAMDFVAVASDEFKGADDRLDLATVASKAEPLYHAGYNVFVVKPSQFIDRGEDLPDFAREAVKAFEAFAD